MAQETMETRNAVNTADPNPVRLNPGTSKDIIYRIIPLITKINRPKVIILIGRVKRIRSGLNMELKIPRSRAVTRRATGSSTSAHGEIFTTIRSAAMVTRSLTRNL